MSQKHQNTGPKRLCIHTFYFLRFPEITGTFSRYLEIAKLCFPEITGTFSRYLKIAKLCFCSQDSETLFSRDYGNIFSMKFTHYDGKTQEIKCMNAWPFRVSVI